MADKNLEVKVAAANLQTARFRIRGTALYVQNKFSEEARQAILKTQVAGSRAKKGGARKPKDVEKLYRDSMYESTEGWRGIPTIAFTKALVSACKTVQFHMTMAKLCIRVQPDCFDKETGVGLVKIVKGAPEKFIVPVKFKKSTTDISVRAMWRQGWEADVSIRFDADIFSLVDISNLLYRVGEQCGIGDGRPDSPNSPGCGWGVFEIIKEAPQKGSRS